MIASPEWVDQLFKSAVAWLHPDAGGPGGEAFTLVVQAHDMLTNNLRSTT